MTSKQQQDVSGGGQAIQAGGSVTIGMSADQMIEIMTKVMQVGVQYTEEANAKVEARLADFRKEIIESFTDGKSRQEALKEPDFQYMLGEAQDAYARNGDAAVRGTLVDIISRRSNAAEASLEALALNDAAHRAPKLTRSEFAALSIAYILKYTIDNSMKNIAVFKDYLNNKLMPFVEDLPENAASYWHIESQSVASISVGSISLREIFLRKYAGLCGLGMDSDMLKQIFPEKADMVRRVLIPCLRDNSKFQPPAQNLAVYTERYADQGLDPIELTHIWNVFAGTVPNDSAFVHMLEGDCPGISKLFGLWDSTSLKNLQLNSVGIAIAHANATRLVKFDAPLSIWIA